MKKKGLLALLIALIAVFSVVMIACSNAPTLTLNETTITLDYEQTVTLVATVEHANDKTVKWTTSKETVATVSDAGVVTAVGSGTAKITATLVEDETVTAECTVTVNAVPVASVAINPPASTTLTLGADPLKLTAKVLPEAATNKVITWSSSNNNIATVIGGVVTPVAPGTVTITVKSSQNAEKTASVELTITRPAITGIIASPSSITVPMNTNYTFIGTVVPTHADPAITWSIVSQSPDSGSDSVIEAVAGSAGTFKALALGTAKVKATSNVNGAIISNEATIEVAPEGTNPMIAISNPGDFKQIYVNPNADYYLTQDIDFNGETLYGANTLMIIDVAVNAADGTYTAASSLAARFIDGAGNNVKHFIDRGTDAYTEEDEGQNKRFFAPYDPASADPLVSARYLMLNGDGTAYAPIAQHDLFSDTSGNLETPGQGDGGRLRAPYAAYKRIMTNTGNPLGASGDSRVFHLRSTAAPQIINGVSRFYQAPVVTFNGVFDGRGYSLKNFEMAIPKGEDRLSLGSAKWGQGGVTDPWGQSLFGNIGYRGIVRNIGFAGMTLDLHGQGGLIASQNNGLIENILITDLKSFKDSGGGDENCGTGLLMGINNPTGRIINVVFDGTGGDSEIGSGESANAIFAMAVANRAGKAAAATQIQNIFMDATRFSSKHFVRNSDRSDNPGPGLERGGYNPTAADNNANLYGDEDVKDFSVLPTDIWDVSGEWPVLKKQTAAAVKVNFTADQIDGNNGYTVYGSPLATVGLDYNFTVNIARTHTVATDLTMTYSVRGVVGAKTATGVAGTTLSDGSVDYTFNIAAANVTAVLTNISFAGVSERGTFTATAPTTIPEGLALTDANGVTITKLPDAIDGQSYTIGIYTQLESLKKANPTIDYSVAGGASRTLEGGYSKLMSGVYTYWFFTVPADEVIGNISFSNLIFNVEDDTIVPVTFSWRAQADPDGMDNWGFGYEMIDNANKKVDVPFDFDFKDLTGKTLNIKIWDYRFDGGTKLAAGQTYQISVRVNGIDFSLKGEQYVANSEDPAYGEFKFVIDAEKIQQAVNADPTKIVIQVRSYSAVSISE